MANVLFSRTDSPSTKPITDGQIIFDTSGNGKMYLDNGTTRLEMGGAINVDATLDATSTNPIQNKGVAGVMLSELEEVRGTTKKGFLTDALATKTLDAKIGTTDISSIGDGTVTGAINDVNGKLTAPTIENNSEYIIGYYNGKPVYRKWYISDNANLPNGLTIIDKSINMQNSEFFSFNGVFWQGKYYMHATTFEYVASGNQSYIFSIRVSKDGVLIQNNNYPGVNKYRLYVDYCAK